MFTAIVLTLLVVICRLCSAHFQMWHFVPMGAVALYAGARLPRRWAWIVPVAGMILSDIFLDYDKYRPIFALSRWLDYAAFAATTLIGPLANRPKFGRWLLPVLSVIASLSFFLISNFGVWAEGVMYPMTFAGLAQCYVAGLLFVGFHRQILADLIGTALLFGLGALVARGVQRWTAPELVADRAS
jgi:hypothetical protein